MDNKLHDSIQIFVNEFRDKVEPYWQQDLLSETYIASPDARNSSGFCGPTSIYLIQELQKRFPDQRFSLTVGRVYKNAQPWIIGKHVWITHHVALKTATVIDITADQSNDITGKTIVRDINELAGDGINYVAYRMARSIEEVDVSPRRRAKLLQQRVESSN